MSTGRWTKVKKIKKAFIFLPQRIYFEIMYPRDFLIGNLKIFQRGSLHEYLMMSFWLNYRLFKQENEQKYINFKELSIFLLKRVHLEIMH